MQKGRLPISANLAILIIIIACGFALGPLVHAQIADFVLSSTPSNLCVNPGVDAVSVIGVESIGGFAATISLSSNVDPKIADGPSSSPIPSSETLVDGQTVNFDLAISTTTSTPTGIYYVTVSGLSGAIFHQTSVQLTVSSGCSVGGSILRLDGLPLLIPYTGVAVLTGLVAALLTVLTMYRRRSSQHMPFDLIDSLIQASNEDE